MNTDIMTLPPGLPDLSSDYRLTDTQIAEYRENGHVFLSGVLSAEEVAAYRDVFRRVIQKRYPNPPTLEKRDVFFKAFLSLSNTFWEEPETRPFIYSRRFAKIAAEMVGADGVRIYHNQVFFKEAGGGPTPWHQDHYYWPIDTDQMTTIWIPLVDITPEMGALRFATGSHRFPFLDEIGITADSMAHFDRFVEEKNLPVVSQAMKAGDATVHAGWTLHSALGNASDRTREVAAVSYYPDGAYVMSDLTKTRLGDLRACLPGVEPGAIAIGDRNPLLYKRGLIETTPTI